MQGEAKMSAPPTGAAATPCPCGSGSPLAACCGRYLGGTVPAPTPEALMRSRYTAYALGDSDYVTATWHSSTRPTRLALETDATRWLRLSIIEATPISGNSGEVDFIADFIAEGCRQTLRETSRFLREGGRWYYLDGRAHWERHKTPGRNESCPCGSGKKYKKCCGG